MPDFIRALEEQSVQVLELSLPDHLDSAEFDRLNEQLLDLITSDRGDKWVLDLSRVRYMGSAMLGLVVNVRQKVKNVRGRLVLCCLSPRLADVLRMSSLERLFTITASRADALSLLR